MNFCDVELEFMFTSRQSDSDGKFKLHIPEIRRFFYGAHLLEYLITVFWKRYIFSPCRCLRSSQYPLSRASFRALLILDQILYFKVGRTSTHQDNSRTLIFIIVGPLVPEIVHSEVWAWKIAHASRNVTTAIFIANSYKQRFTILIARVGVEIEHISERDGGV